MILFIILYIDPINVKLKVWKNYTFSFYLIQHVGKNPIFDFWTFYHQITQDFDWKHVLITMIWHCLRICMKLSKNLKIFEFWLGISNDLLIKVKKNSFHKLIHKGLFHWIRSILTQIVLYSRFRKWFCNHKYHLSKPQKCQIKKTGLWLGTLYMRLCWTCNKLLVAFLSAAR